jgi:anaerobic magnesium-protoporphyrin IX monomethyl ester cyclase
LILRGIKTVAVLPRAARRKTREGWSMPRNQIAFVAYLDHDNLGVGYMASMLLEKGFAITLVDMREQFPTILQSLLDAQALVTGFSIVFQYHLDEFKDLMTYLRKGGVDCHFCAGGHYPSFRYQELLSLAPELDSIVLFEGEHTFAELSEAVREGRDWRQILGIAYKDNGAVRCTGLRPLEDNLDKFPLPVRKPAKQQVLGRNVVNILAGRGCYYNCSFCSIRSFYAQPPGKVKRIRKPEYVVREMQLHYQEEDCTIFLFQDDDFPVAEPCGRAWLENFCWALRKAGLQDRIFFKISCRPNEIDEGSLSLMMAHGLGMVYLGIESGTLRGLELMRKQISPETSLGAVKTLKKLGMAYEFGFMVFDPGSTFDTVRENLVFLEALCGDGSAAVSLGKMLPLAGTRIEDELRQQKRLRGASPYEDYAFTDPLLDEYFHVLSDVFRVWMHGNSGLMTLSRWVNFQVAALRRFHICEEDTRVALWNIVSSANRFLIRSCEHLSHAFQSSSKALRDTAVSDLASEVAIKHDEFAAKLFCLYDRVSELASNPEGADLAMQ